MTLNVFTVGHSTHDVQYFISLLRRHGVGAVADVRSTPFSRFVAHFNRDALSANLADSGIDYVFLGEELGARSNDRSVYHGGRVQFTLLGQTELFKGGVRRLLRGASGGSVAVMCTEKDPLDCHRTLLVGRALITHGANVTHILADGRLESDEEAMMRLRRQYGLDQPDLFRSAEQLLEEALQRREEQIAYVLRDPLPTTIEEG